jgi:hypothetical protein
MKQRTCWTLLTTLALASGCSLPGKDWKKMQFPWLSTSKIKASEFGTPAKMVAIWTPDILAQPGKPATRGFGGRLYFYNEKSQAIPVEGQLVVYAYDDTIDPHQTGQPQRKYGFTPDQFTQHYSDSDLGASYSIWLPWDPVGGNQSNISLVPVFTSTSGQIVMGQQAVNVLPGLKSPSPGLPEQPLPQVSYLGQRGVQQVAHQQTDHPVATTSFAGATAPTAPEPRMRSSTIRLTPSLQRRVAEATNAPQMSGSEAPVPGATMPAVPQLPASPIAIPPPASPAVTPAGAAGPAPPRAHFGHHQFRVRGGLAGRPTPPPPWTPPYPEVPPFGHQSASSPAPTAGYPAAW